MVHWPLQPPERCSAVFVLLTTRYRDQKALREGIMLEIQSLLRMAVLTPRHSSRCSSSPGLPHARHVEAGFPAGPTTAFRHFST